jgi:hypothetical protein
VKDRVRRDTLDAAVVLANPHSADVRIVLGSVPPDSASPGVEAWTVFRKDGKGDRVVLYTESSVFICASRHAPVHVNPYICLLKLASIIVHEAWHFRNGPDEAGAYEAQLQFLEVRGAGSAGEIAEGVRRARDRVKAQRLPGATGAPMTYMHRGKQCVVIAIGGQRHAAEFVAFALP